MITGQLNAWTHFKFLLCYFRNLLISSDNLKDIFFVKRRIKGVDNTSAIEGKINIVEKQIHTDNKTCPFEILQHVLNNLYGPSEKCFKLDFYAASINIFSQDPEIVPVDCQKVV